MDTLLSDLFKAYYDARQNKRNTPSQLRFKMDLETNLWVSFLPKDLYLLALAETINATYIVSGDADLTDLNQHKQTQILKLADFKKLMSYS